METRMTVEEILATPVAELLSKLRTHSEIVLEKVTDGAHPDKRNIVSSLSRPCAAKVGDRFRWSYKSLTHDQALQRAAKALVAQYPCEDRVWWREVRPE